VKLDLRHLPDGAVAKAKDVETELRRIRHELKPLEIVLINTRAGQRAGQDDYVGAGCGMGREATLFLLERGVRELCASSSAKRRSGKSWERGEAYSQTPEARLRQPEPRRERAPALAPSQSNRFVKKPSRSL
jgi:kynurenine formamidase